MVDYLVLDQSDDLSETQYMWQSPQGTEYELHGCFGYIGDALIIGMCHHQEIMALLINKGWTWTDLMEAEQIWGWYTIDKSDDSADLNYVSDAAYLHKSASKKCKQAFRDLGLKKVTGKHSLNGGDVETRDHGEYGGDYNRHYAPNSKNLKHTIEHSSVVSEIPDPPAKVEA